MLDNYEAAINIGLEYTVETIVDGHNTARAIHSGSIDVFSTPMMIALMESAAYECIQPLLEDGVTSLGTLVNIEHIAASPLGAKISATAIVTSVAGRRVEFSVSAVAHTSMGTKEIGRGSHTRAVVDINKFMAKLAHA